MRHLAYWILEGPNGREFGDNGGLKPLEKYSERKFGALSGGRARPSDSGSTDYHIGINDLGQWPFSTKQAWSLY